MKTAKNHGNRYQAIITAIFADHFRPGIREMEFSREELEKQARRLRVVLPKNLGDLLYSFRFRQDLPEEITATASDGRGWVIELAGRGRYRFRMARLVEIRPNPNLIAAKIPDATPEIVAAYALSDEQALLARVRYNRIVDIFVGVAAYSLQNHLRTTVREVGQIEIDEVYIGINRLGQQFVMPVQAKGGTDRLSTTQTYQDIECCRERFPGLVCRPISAQFMSGDVIAMFELGIEGDEVKIIDERHYKLVPADQISAEELSAYSRR